MNTHPCARACIRVCARVCVCTLVCPCTPPHLQEAPGAASYEDVRVAGRLGPPLLVGGGGQGQQGVAIDPEEDRVDHSYACDGEAHSLEEAQELQRDTARGVGAVVTAPLPSPALAGPPLAGNHSWARPRGGGGRLRLGTAQRLLGGTRPPLRPPVVPDLGLLSLFQGQSTAGGEGSGHRLPRGLPPQSPQKQATHRLMAVSLDHTVNDAPVRGLGLQSHLQGAPSMWAGWASSLAHPSAPSVLFWFCFLGPHS